LGLIRNYQRRALEKVINIKEPDEPITIGPELSFYLGEETEIFFTGISKGIGTCADLHGIDIAVFGLEKPKKLPKTTTTSQKHSTIRFFALVRIPTEEEKREILQQHTGNPDNASVYEFKIVQGIAPIYQIEDTIWFFETSKQTHYVCTVC